MQIYKNNQPVFWHHCGMLQMCKHTKQLIVLVHFLEQPVESWTVAITILLSSVNPVATLIQLFRMKSTLSDTDKLAVTS